MRSPFDPFVPKTMIVTPSDGLEVGDTKITARDSTPIAVYFAAPQRAGKFPAVLVIPEIWGAHEHIKDVARRLAKSGYFALVVEPYTRIGDLGCHDRSQKTDGRTILRGSRCGP